MININIEQKSVIIHAIIGVIIGAVSGILSSDPYQVGNGFIFLLMLVVLVVTGQLVQKLFNLADEKTPEGDKKYDFKWWMMQGGLIYVGFWLIVWVLFYNRFLV